MEKMTRKALEKEIELILSRFDFYAYDDEELKELRQVLQPVVDCWNDAESEYQHLVDIMGGGIEEYNYDNYMSNEHERHLINKINNMTVDTYHCFVTPEVIEAIYTDFIEHRTQAKIEKDYDNNVIIIHKETL